jgi:ribulose-phosphate 3-epimerase
MKAMSVEFNDVYPISKRRNAATRMLAKEWKITPEAIRDKYTRQLGITAKEFDNLLKRLFENRDKTIFQLLRKHGGDSDQVAINELEQWLETKSIKTKNIKLAPSILSADFARLGEQVAEATKAGADYIHVDVMDGHFVPQITIGAPVVAAIRPWTNLPLDVHLMIGAPEHQIEQFADAGADIITVHIEVCPHIHRVVQAIKKLGVKAGVSLNPGTPVETLSEVLPSLDLVLVMTVNPGFGGQAFIEETLGKITHLRAELDRKGLAAELEVDGGINAENAPRVVRAGARVLVAGAAVFNSGQTVKQALARIRGGIEGG